MTKDEAMARIKAIKFFEGFTDDMIFINTMEFPSGWDVDFRSTIKEDTFRAQVNAHSSDRPTESAALTALVEEIEARFGR